MTTVKDCGNAGPQEKQYGKFYHGTTSKGDKFKRTGTEKVSVISLMKETLYLLLYLFICLLYNFLIIFITKIWAQLIRLVWTQN